MELLAETYTVLNRLEASMPLSVDAARGADLDSRARGTLALLFDRMRATNLSGMSTYQSDPATCPNCGTPIPTSKSPYCSDCCREQAAFVRQMRDSLAKGTILEEERQVSKGEVLWRLLGGGLPRRLSQVPEKARAQVFNRDNLKCQTCGAPATTIDNTGSG